MRLFGIYLNYQLFYDFSGKFFLFLDLYKQKRTAWQTHSNTCNQYLDITRKPLCIF